MIEYNTNVYFWEKDNNLNFLFFLFFVLEMDLDNLTVDEETLNKVNNYCTKNEIKKFPKQLYIYLLHILKDKIDSYDIASGKIKNLLWRKEEGIIADSNSIEVLDYALENDIISVNDAFMGMCKFGKIDLIKHILSNNDIDKRILSKGLDIAVINNHLDVVEYLVSDTKADVNYNDGMPLKSAVRLGYLKIVYYLANHGADIYRNHGEILQLAKKHNKQEVIRYLNKYII